MSAGRVIHDRDWRLGPFSFVHWATRGSIPYRQWRVGRLALTRHELRTKRRRAYWTIHWRWRGDYHSAFLRPRVEWHHRNTSAIARMEEQERIEAFYDDE